MISSLNENSYKRPAPRRNEIVDSIHSQIIDGRLKPNDRLPTRRCLQKKFDVSMVTIQQAVDRLVSEGFVESRGVGGTFVSDNPPHLNQYVVIVPAKHLDNSTPIFWRTLVDSFADYASRNDISIKFHYWSAAQVSNPESRSLARNVSRRSIAGLVFITPPLGYETEKLKLINSGSVPCAVILHGEAVGKFNAATVILDGLSFIHKTMVYFIGNGRKRLAVIANFRKEDWWEDLKRIAKEKKIETRPYWNISVSNEDRGSARNLANLLMQLPEEKLPDALLIADDNLAMPVLAGLQDSGAAAARKLMIVSHSNFPFRVHTQLPVKFLGYDSAQVIESFMRVLERQRKGEEAVDVCEKVNPVFDDEIMA